MKKFVIKKSDLSTMTTYDGEYAGGELSNEALYAHVELPEGMPSNLAKAEMVDDEIVMMLDEDRAMECIRMERNMKLSACDYTQLADAPLSSEEKTAWATYRQALRDMPETVEDLASPEWPEEP